MNGETKSERTVKHNKGSWKTSKIYSKTGLLCIETGRFYRQQGSRPEKYGHRKSFTWETKEEIEKVYEVDNISYDIPHYFINFSEEIVNEISSYIKSKDPLEQAQLERETFNKERSNEALKHHEETMEVLNDHFKDVLKEMTDEFSNILSKQSAQANMLQTVLKNQDEDKQIHCDTDSKLDAIHKNVQETQEVQNVILNSTYQIQEDISEIKTSQVEIFNSVVKHEDLEEMVKTEAEKYAVREELKAILKENDPTPSIKREIEKGAKNVRETVERTRTALERIGIRF